LKNDSFCFIFEELRRITVSFLARKVAEYEFGVLNKEAINAFVNPKLHFFSAKAAVGRHVRFESVCMHLQIQRVHFGHKGRQTVVRLFVPI